jgi:hypothetical protein
MRRQPAPERPGGGDDHDDQDAQPQRCERMELQVGKERDRGMVRPARGIRARQGRRGRIGAGVDGTEPGSRQDVTDAFDL